MKGRKLGPFKVPVLSDGHPLYARLLAGEAERLDSLPDFSDDKGLFVFSDFGGEHKEADFTTYSILICSADKRCVFDERVNELRRVFGLNDPWKELCFKGLKYGPVSRALEGFLYLADNFVHGALITILVDKKIPSMFGANKHRTHQEIRDLLQENGLGKWRGGVPEKLLRVSHAIGVFMSLLAHSGQRVMWLCDHDSINEEGKDRGFAHTQKIFAHCLNMYCDNIHLEIGFAKPFFDDAGTSDLLSLTDFSAGIMQEIIQSKMLSRDLELSNEKAKLAEWMGTKSAFLTKINLVFLRDESDGVSVRTVNIQKKV